MPKKLKGGPLGCFNIHSVAKRQKNEGGTLWGKFFPEKSLAMPKETERVSSFGLVRYCMLRGKPFWFSFLGQRVQFGGFLKFCRTFGVELFWSLQVYRKKTSKRGPFGSICKFSKKVSQSRKYCKGVPFGPVNFLR